MAKEIVTVEADYRSDGMIMPKTVIWKDGRHFSIDKIIYYSTSPSGEYEGIRYTVLIGSSEKYIYRVRNKWYVMTRGRW